MARLRGCGGSVLIGTSTVGAVGVKEWTLDYTVDIIDGRGFDDACQPHPVVGMVNWGGSLRALKDGVPLTMFTTAAISLRESTTTGQLYTGSAIFTEFHETVPVDGLIECSYTYLGIGTLTVATA